MYVARGRQAALVHMVPRINISTHGQGGFKIDLLHDKNTTLEMRAEITNAFFAELMVLKLADFVVRRLRWGGGSQSRGG